VKSIAPGSFISIYPPKGHPSKRAGPYITIRTSTFVELLGHAREWDAKFPALAGASRAYLIESFAFADNFCSYAAKEERRRPKPKIIHRLAALIAVLFFAVVPVRGEAQNLNASIVGFRGWSDQGHPEYYTYWAQNDDQLPVNVVALTLNFQSYYDPGWIIPPNGWSANIRNYTVVFTAGQGYAIPPGGGAWFVLFGPANDGTIDYQLVGIWPGTEDGKAALGKTDGHSN
jgi:hypothetical protein